jgi:hypothetical protein
MNLRTIFAVFAAKKLLISSMQLKRTQSPTNDMTSLKILIHFLIKIADKHMDRVHGVFTLPKIFLKFYKRHARLTSLIHSTVILSILTLSCRAELKVKTRSGPKKSVVTPNSKIEPIEVIDGLNIDRAYLQSRTPISIVISADTINAGNYFHLTNESNNETLISHQYLGLTDDSISSFQIANPDQALEISAYELILKIYPLDSTFAGKFTTGENILKILVASDSSPKQAKTTLHRKDYYLLSSGGGSFSSLEQRNSGFELYPGMEFGQSTVTNGTRVLITNPISLLSR